MQSATDLHDNRRYSNRQLLRRLWPFMRPLRWHFAGAFFALLISRALMLSGPLLVKRAIDHDIPESDLVGLQLTVGGYLAVQIVNLLVIYLMRNWMEWNGQSLMAALRRRLFDHLLAMPVSFHDRHSPGQLMARVESDTQSLQMLFTTTVVMLAGDAIFFTGMAVVMVTISLRLTLVIACLLPVMILVTRHFQRRIHPIFVEVRRWNTEVSGRLTEFLRLLPVIRQLQTGAWALREFLQVNRQKYEVNVPGENLVVTWFNLIVFLQSVTLTAILGLGGYWALSGIVTIGTLALFVGYLRRFFEPLMQLSEQLAAIQKSFAGAERIFSLLDESPGIADPVEAVDAPGLDRDLVFDDVWFRYAEDADWILKGISFRMPAGECWALVGRTGSGKSTIISLVQRFHDPQRGRITVDDVNLHDLRQADLRAIIGVVPQEICVFPGPLRMNITMGRPELESRLDGACRSTGLDAVIESLPEGMETTLREAGANLSVGQRQLLSCTRALIREPRLLIFDEATSSLDPQSEAALAQATRNAVVGRSALVVTHRLSTIRDCDCILVLDEGEIVARGTHEDLLDRCRLYQHLWFGQSAGFTARTN